MALGYEETVRALESRGVMPDRPPGLEAIREALSRLELSFDPDRTIVVAGTNGKGSVSATLEALYLSAGEKTGLYTSPHLVDTTERFRLSGVDVSRELFLAAHERVEAATRDLRLSHFEMLTAMGGWLFCSSDSPARAERLILEVGLGGIWDATNAFSHSCCVITRLGVDHQNLLGSSLLEIARNKFGIVAEGAIVAHAPLDPSLHALSAETRSRTLSRWVESEPWELRVERGKEPRYFVKTKWGTVEPRLPGKRGAENTVLALTAFAAFGGDPARHLSAVSRVRWEGRMQKVSWPGARCPVYLSGDHNPQGVASLIELLADYSRERLHVLVGIGVDKESDPMLEALSSLPGASIYLTETPFKGRKIADYGAWSSRAAGAWADPLEAMQIVVKRAGEGDLILVTGSLYLVGRIASRISR